MSGERVAEAASATRVLSSETLAQGSAAQVRPKCFPGASRLATQSAKNAWIQGSKFGKTGHSSSSGAPSHSCVKVAFSPAGSGDKGTEKSSAVGSVVWMQTPGVFTRCCFCAIRANVK